MRLSEESQTGALGPSSADWAKTTPVSRERRGWAVLLTLLVTGCATPPPVLPPVEGPVGLSLALAPVAITYEPTASRPPKSQFSLPYRPRLELEGLDRTLVGLLQERGAFTAVTLPSGGPDTGAGQPAAPVSRPATPAEPPWVCRQ